MEDIRRNIEMLNEKVQKAAERAGRKVSDVTIVGVTKTVDIPRILEMVRLGISHVGENRVQELVAKKAELDGGLPNISWHMIGHLQTNKAKLAVQSAVMIHSVDSQKLAEAVDRAAASLDKICDICVEVNIADESSKYGIKPQDAERFIESILQYKNINIRGLMCIAPFVENGGENRKYFAKMREMRERLNEKFIGSIKMDVLSCGMSIDYEAAILEHADYIRCGSIIFGNR
ncbi:MAG: YggS family pyridoxal phosphate-dependent enzyme [Defluviitaleaceae bacterium]|nr:YggS family pyridoxal phosphate-dependent enzyme [Defluviitaleaceae bacterium]